MSTGAIVGVSAAAVVLLSLLVGPFLIPLPPLQGTSPVRQLAGPESGFVVVDGVEVHYTSAGWGEPVFLLLHGFGASTFSWREVMAPLAAMGTVIAYDRPSSGLTARRAILVGNSAGGTVAMLAALRHPERVEALVLVDPAAEFGGPPLAAGLLGSPQGRRILQRVVRGIGTWGSDALTQAWHDPSKITPAIREGCSVALRADNWDRGLVELTRASRPLGLSRQLGKIAVPTLVIPECGHVPQEEKPEQFLAAVREFVEGLAAR
ncbi:MAG: alpha/beta hydrolase [Spirochaetes bacterium]|nr:alpha/beta hydrolase [Spirochaetota bacterium]